MRILVLLTAIFMVSGCVQPTNLKHYRVLDVQKTSSEHFNVHLRAFAIVPKSPGGSAQILQLSERAQAALIDAIAPRVDPHMALLEVMRNERSHKGDCVDADQTSFSRRLLISLVGELPRPADRVDRIEFKVKFSNASALPIATFSSWDRFDSLYFSLNFGSAKFNQSNTVGLGNIRTTTSNLPNDMGGLEKVINLKAEHTNTLEESIIYAGRRLSVAGALEPSEATLVLEGGPLLSLFGTASATLSMVIEPQLDNVVVHQISLKDAKSLPLNSDKVTVIRCNVMVSPIARDLNVDIESKVTVRLVRRGDDTVTESDDSVVYQRINPSVKNVLFVSKKDLSFSTYGLSNCANRAKVDAVCPSVGIATDEASPGRLKYEFLSVGSQSEAIELREWLLSQTKSQGGAVTHLAGREVGIWDPSRLQFVRGLDYSKLRNLSLAVIKTNKEVDTAFSIHTTVGPAR